MNLPAPRLFEYLATELLSDGLEIVYSKVHEGVRSGVTRVLGQEQPGTFVPGEGDKGRETWLEPVLPLLCVAEPSIPRDGRGCFNDP